MKKRKIFIEGMAPPKPVVPEAPDVFRPPQGGDAIEYNRAVNELRGLSLNAYLRHGSDAWPVKESVTAYAGGTDFFRIVPELRPEGCAQVWYMHHNEETDNDLNRVWAVTACVSGSRSLVAVFIRAPILEVKHLPFNAAHIVSMNIRPIRKIRFGSHDYFVPEHNFVYVGYPYR